MTNRLQREMRKLKPGDEASLEVWNGARYRTVKVKTVSAEDLTPERVTRAEAGDRPALGLSLGSSGSRRDTLGVFVSSVTDNGPADKAGIAEGDRIASINGVDLRVAKDDIGDFSVANSRISRLQREVAKLKPGQTVDLVVVQGGRSRTVKVTLGRMGDLERENGYVMHVGDGRGFITMPRVRIAPMAPMAPMAPLPPDAPTPPRARIRTCCGEEDIDLNLDGLRESLQDLGPRIREQLDRELPRIRDEIDFDLPNAMDQLRDQMNRMRIEMPMLRMRSGRGVII